MEGLSFGELMNAMAEPDKRFLPHRGDQLPELRGDLGKDAGPVAYPRLPEKPCTPVPGRVRPLKHPAPLGRRRQADPDRSPQGARQNVPISEKERGRHIKVQP